MFSEISSPTLAPITSSNHEAVEQVCIIVENRHSHSGFDVGCRDARANPKIV